MKVWVYTMGKIRSSFGRVISDVLSFFFNTFFTLKLFIKKDKKPSGTCDDSATLSDLEGDSDCDTDLDVDDDGEVAIIGGRGFR